MATETEAKFIVPDQETFSRLRKITRFGPYIARDSHIEQVRDRYLDTPDRGFLRRRFAARVRERDSGLQLTLKALGRSNGAVHSREEYEADVQGLEISAWPPSEARSLAEEIAAGTPLDDLVAVDQTRTFRDLYEGERLVAEWSLDDVTIPTAGEPLRFYELEVELRPGGTPEDLARLCDLFTGKYGLQLQPESKFERALALSTAASSPNAGKKRKRRRPGLLPTDSMASAARKLLTVQVEAISDQEEAVCKGEDPTAVKRMRVATRRMRAILRLAGNYLPTRELGRVNPNLRDLADTLGILRDRDVMLGNAYAFRAVLPDNQRPDLDGLLAAWNADRERAFGRLSRLLEGKAYPRLKRRIRALLETEDNPARGDGDVEPLQVRHVAGSVLWARYGAVRAYETVMDAPTIPQLHALRIVGKYLRYGLEFYSEVLAEDTDVLIRDITAMQDQLGALHDADVAASEIQNYLAGAAKGKRKARSDVPPGLAAYLADRQRAAASVHADFAATWTRISAPAWRARLAMAVAAL